MEFMDKKFIEVSRVTLQKSISGADSYWIATLPPYLWPSG